jgi:NAD(P)-dependent dehydrogenase (short-subunit alcohol dehydrogenase family)
LDPEKGIDDPNYPLLNDLINPVLTDTPIVQICSDKTKKTIISGIPLGRMARPEDVAYAALYLASDESSMVTGSSINVDGGLAV